MRRGLPRGLYARSLLIIIIPMVLLQTVVAAVFMERHWQLVTTRLSAAVTRDIGAIIDLAEMPAPNLEDRKIIQMAQSRFGLMVALDPPQALPEPRPAPYYSILDSTLSDQITRQIKRPFWLDISANGGVEIRIPLQDNLLRVVVPIKLTYASNTHIFLFWMVGASLVLLAISILFLRGQIRPILTLARAAEDFGKGQKPVEAFYPRGADEIRRAGFAFLQMRERIERQMEQRTAMLNGVSHDLRTILTRFKLQLAISDNAGDLENLNRDVEDMGSMLEAYLAFASSDIEEMVAPLDLAELMKRLKDEARLRHKTLTFALKSTQQVHVRPVAFTRMIVNLVSNACRHGNNIHIHTNVSARWLSVTIDDDGEGIAEAMREDVFKPFFRLDEARNLDASGTGLGLAIARDIARSHGGNVTLSESPSGGLRARVRVPV